jgi:dihydrolipoamide dehydrogenase
MNHDVIVIGAGPAGYVCAIRCAQLGLKVAVVEREALGGVCLNVGCIPSKALIAAAKLRKKIGEAAHIGIEVGDVKLDVGKLVAWKEGVVGKLTGGVAGLLKNHKCDVFLGSAKLVAPGKVDVTGSDGKKTSLAARNVVVATGSSPIEIPGFAFDREHVWTSTDALAPRQLPRRMLVIGGGYIGLELGLVYHNLGTEITVVEALDRVLSGMEAELSKEMGRFLKKRKIPVHLGAKAKGWRKTKEGLQVDVEAGGKVETFACDVILSTVGRRPNSAGFGLESLGVRIEKGFVQVDAQRRTNVPGVYAIGDVAGQPMLAHKGSHEGLVAAAAIAGDKGAAFDPACIPAVIFTDPEIASVGLTADEARARGFEPVEGRFPFAASGRALAIDEPDGWVKVVADAKSDRLLGVHMIGPEVTELIAEAALAIELGATAGDLAQTIHAHPTLPEALMEAAEAVHGMAVHIFQKPAAKPAPAAAKAAGG